MVYHPVRMMSQERVLLENPLVLRVLSKPHTVVIATHSRAEVTDEVTLTEDEATKTAFAILKNDFARKGLNNASAPLRTCAQLLGIDLNDMELES